MRWHSLVPVLSAVAIAAVLALSGCGGDDDLAATDPANTTAATNAEKEARKEAARRIREQGRRRKGDKRPTKGLSAAQRSRRLRRNKGTTAAERRRASAGRRRRERRSDSREDREFDRGFRETSFEKLVARLPIRKPRLYVQQYITNRGSHRVFTAVSRRRFLCDMTPAERRRAVARFFRSADRVMRAGGVDDFVQVVTLTSQTAQELPALANARRGSVRLTERGRERDPC